MKLALGAAVLGGTIAVANASVATGAAGPGGYDAHRPCDFYVNHHLPGPGRCYRFFSNALGPDVYVRYGFVFRDRDSFVHFRDRSWFKNHSRLAANESPHPAREEDRTRERVEQKDEARLATREGHHGMREKDRVREQDRMDQYAEREQDESARGEIARESGSGGASHGATVYEKTESGGAGRGEETDEGTSGGASGY
ncbi:MAG TPA: hypothetical protein VHW69_12870 [Rhizomicrobium sp.]|jgi:hypothetical protein|nr:hypothetical protein [Rhizomicrobium sp.]